MDIARHQDALAGVQRELEQLLDASAGDVGPEVTLYRSLLWNAKAHVKAAAAQLDRLPATVHDLIAAAAGIRRARVRCEICRREGDVDGGACLRSGWPICHGATMTLLSPSRDEEGGSIRST